MFESFAERPCARCDKAKYGGASRMPAGPHSGLRPGLVAHCVDQTGIDAVGSARTLALVSTIGFIAGAAGLTGGAVLFLSEPRANPRTGAAPRWVSAGVEPTGRDGVLARVQGVW